MRTPIVFCCALVVYSLLVPQTARAQVKRTEEWYVDVLQRSAVGGCESVSVVANEGHAERDPWLWRTIGDMNGDLSRFVQHLSSSTSCSKASASELAELLTRVETIQTAMTAKGGPDRKTVHKLAWSIWEGLHTARKNFGHVADRPMNVDLAHKRAVQQEKESLRGLLAAVTGDPEPGRICFALGQFASSTSSLLWLAEYILPGGQAEKAKLGGLMELIYQAEGYCGGHGSRRPVAVGDLPGLRTKVAQLQQILQAAGH